MIRMNVWPEGKSRALTFSYDDGQRADIRLVELFNRYGVKGSFHLNSGLFGLPNYITEDDAKTIYCGHEISVHTRSHPFLTNTPREEIIDEVMEDRKRLEAIAGYPVRGMSYPYGRYDADLIRILRELGMEYARTVQNARDSFHLPADWMEWMPTCHHRGDLRALGERFLQEKHVHGPLLFYVWGHSYEFDRDNNWHVMEEFLASMANNSDVWYATNIRIVDYMQACRSLRFSANREMVYNPAAIDVWFTYNEQVVCAKAGETLHIAQHTRAQQEGSESL